MAEARSTHNRDNRNFVASRLKAISLAEPINKKVREPILRLKTEEVVTQLDQ
jgi:hypothetical protein